MNTKYTLLPESYQMIAERSFTAPKSKVWKYYTNAELLDKWWAPKPYKAITKSFDFREGGHWHYIMTGPGGDEHYCVNLYKTIVPEESISVFDGFAHKDWSINNDLPGSEWEITFVQKGSVTDVRVVLTCANVESLNTLVEMGMQQGFDMGLNQLEVLLKE